MFLENGAWTRLPDTKAALDRVLQGPSSPKLRQSFGVDDRARLQVVDAHVMDLPFYRSHDLYRLDIALKSLDLEKEFEAAAAYALVGKGIRARESHFLNGQSFVIHQVSRSYWSPITRQPGLPIDAEDRPAWLAYLEFYATFVARDQNPLMIVKTPEDLPWALEKAAPEAPADAAPPLQTSFTRLLSERKSRLFEAENAYPMPRDVIEDYLQGRISKQDLEEAAGKRAADESEDKDLRSAVAEHVIEPRGWWAPEEGRFYAQTSLLFDRTFAHTSFKISPTGEARIAEYDPLEDDLPLRKPLFHRRFPLLMRQRARVTMDADEFRAALIDWDRRHRTTDRGAQAKPPAPAADAPAAASVAPSPLGPGPAAATGGEKPPFTIEGSVSNIRVYGDLDLSSLTFAPAIEWDDVEIIGDLVLSDGLFRSSLHLNGLNIAGRLRAENIRCEAHIGLPDLTVHGLHDRGRARPSRIEDPHDVSVGASFTGSFIDGGLELSRGTIYGGLNLEELDVKGGLDLSGVAVERRAPTDVERAPFGLSLRGAKIGRDVTLAPTETRVNIHDARPSRIAGDLRLSGADIEGRLILTDLRTTPRRQRDERLCRAFNGETPGAALDGAETKAFLEQIETEHAKVFYMPESRPDQDDAPPQPREPLLVLAPRRSDDPETAGRLDMRELSVKRSTVATQLDIAGDIDFSSANLNESLDLSRAKTRNGGSILGSAAHVIGHVIVGGAQIEGDLDVTAAEIGGRLNGDPATVERGQRREPLQVWGDVTVSGASIGSDLRLSAARIHGDFLAITGTFGRIRLRPAMVENGAPPERAMVRSVRMQSVTALNLDLSAVRVACSAEAEPHRDQGCVFMYNVTLQEGLRLFRDDLVYLMSEEPEVTPPENLKASDYRAQICGRFETRQLRAGGDVILSHAEIDGPLELVHARIGGDLLAEPRLKASPRIGADGSPGEAAEAPLVMKAHGLDLRLAQCDGDADLSGIELLAPRPGDAEGAETGDLEARGARFAGAFDLVDGDLVDERIHLKHQKLPYAKVAGRIDLSGLTAESVSVSGASLTEAVQASKASGLPAEEARNIGEFSLERARISRITLVKPLPDRPDLADLEVQKWEYLDPAKGERGSSRDLRRSLQLLLSRSLPYNRAIYASVERFLRDTGDDTAADEVYRQMRWREIRPEKLRARFSVPSIQQEGSISVIWIEGLIVALAQLVIFRWARSFEALWSTLIGALTSFLTRGWRPLLYMNLVLLPCSLLILTDPENIAPSTFQLSESRGDGPGSGRPLHRGSRPLATEWREVEQARLILQTHVPVVPLLISPRWVPAENRDLCAYRLTFASAPSAQPAPAPTDDALREDETRCGPDSLRIEGVSPAAYALLVRVMHWIAWPLALAGIAARLQRRRSD